MPRLRTFSSQTDKERQIANTSRMRKARQSHSSTRNWFRTRNIGRGFSETTTFIRHNFDDIRICSYCNARLFSSETQGACCGFGKIK